MCMCDRGRGKKSERERREGGIELFGKSVRVSDTNEKSLKGRLKTDRVEIRVRIKSRVCSH